MVGFVDMMNKNLRRAVKLAEVKLNEADCAIQKIEMYLTFYRFRAYTPNVSACNGSNEIIIEYCGREISIETAIDIMESVGYITPEDFDS